MLRIQAPTSEVVTTGLRVDPPAMSSHNIMTWRHYHSAWQSTPESQSVIGITRQADHLPAGADIQDLFNFACWLADRTQPDAGGDALEWRCEAGDVGYPGAGITAHQALWILLGSA